MNELNLLKEIEKELKKNKGSNIEIINVKDKTPFVDYYVLATALNVRHIEALIRYIDDLLTKNKIKINHIEGKPESNWMLIDAEFIVINVFSKEERERINLEELLNNNKKKKITVKKKKPIKKVTKK